jgi:hypothetical protein
MSKSTCWAMWISIPSAVDHGVGLIARRSALLVREPTIPSRVRPLHPWNATTACQVRVLKAPSTALKGR